MYSLLDQIIDQQSVGASVVGEQHDTGKVNYGGEAAIKSARGGRPSGPWDAAEYGMTLEAAQAAWDAAQTPEAREKVTADLKVRALGRAGLDTTGGRVRMFAAGMLPWHGLGVQVDKAATSAEAIKFAGLDWNVEKRPLSYQWNGQAVTAPGVFGIVRTDSGAMLGNVGNRYKPVQNADGFDFLDGVLAEYGARYESAGSIHGGKSVWMLANMPNQRFTINGGDEVEPYVIFTNCHDGSGSAWCHPTTVRVVCANTFRTSARERSKGLAIRHTGSVKSKITAAQSALGFAVEGFEQFRGAAEAMYRKSLAIRPYAASVLDEVLAVSESRQLVADLIGANRKADLEEAEKVLIRKQEQHAAALGDILERYESERCGIGSIRGTAWAAFNAITEHADHNTLGRQAKDLEERRSRRFESTLNGQADELKQLAYVKAMA